MGEHFDHRRAPINLFICWLLGPVDNLTIDHRHQHQQHHDHHRHHDPYDDDQLGVDFEEKTADMRDVRTRGVFEAGKLVLVEKVSPSSSSSSASPSSYHNY